MNNKIIIISFSSRNNGNCDKIADFIDINVRKGCVFKFSSFRIQPCGECRYECFQSRDACPYIDDMECCLLEAICQSEETYFIVPSYAGYPCSNFFVFNERSQCFFQGQPDLLEHYLSVPKKFIVISNTDIANFREAFTQHTTAEPNILILSARKYRKSSISGDILNSEQACADLTLFASE